MRIKGFLIYFLKTYSVTLVVSAAVSYLYSLIVHGTGVFDWATAFRFGISFGLLFPLIREIDRRQRVKG